MFLGFMQYVWKELLPLFKYRYLMFLSIKISYYKTYDTII